MNNEIWVSSKNWNEAELPTQQDQLKQAIAILRNIVAADLSGESGQLRETLDAAFDFVMTSGA